MPQRRARVIAFTSTELPVQVFIQALENPMFEQELQRWGDLGAFGAHDDERCLVGPRSLQARGCKKGNGLP